MKEDLIDLNHFLEKTEDLNNVSALRLYVISTPIGNLDDISFRALNILQRVNFILAEDSRVSGILLKKYNIRTKVISYFSRSENQKLDLIISKLLNGESAALISDAGTPCISDPGSILVNECIKNSICVIAVPGASSITNSLILSGYNIDKFYFHGFLPVKKGRNKTFGELKNIKMPIVIFESKYRIKETLKDCLTVFGNKEISIFRELTKKFEEAISGRLKDVLTKGKFINKGEFTLVINNK
ncbi:MAG TPA: 16S rRNA (cytidine(1402)-2'-O)-methyltransferase [Ignavibacteria bacterium]